MRFLTFPDELRILAGDWQCVPDIRVSNIVRRDIYRPRDEPGFVAWAILWKERSGTLKLSFAEATGDPTVWPPVMNFNARDIRYYLKTLVSEDCGRTWTDTGWREDLDPLWEHNSDHHIRHVFALPDGTLMRNYCHCIKGLTKQAPRNLYDSGKEGKTSFAFSKTEADHALNYKVGSIWTSQNSGETWNEIHVFQGEPQLFIQGIHPLRDGTIVALGNAPNSASCAENSLLFSESTDGGGTWSLPRQLATDVDVLNPQNIGGENDFVELADGRLFVINRTAKGCFRQTIIERDTEGSWQAGPAEINKRMVHSGYPYMHRASDGTIFFYAHTSMVYSCDEGRTWGNFPFGQAYYGQMTELAPGRMLTVVQRNIGDQPFPWRHDSAIRQTTFDYEPTAVPVQRDPRAIGALAALKVGEPDDFHLALEIRLGSASGLAYNVGEAGYCFVALTMAVTRDRLEEEAPRAPQNVFIQIGEVGGGETRIQHLACIGQALEGDWVEFQLSRHGNCMKTACSLSLADVWDALYHCYRDTCADRRGALALFTNRSTGAFRNVRFAPAPLAIRENWLRPSDWMSTNPNFVSYTNEAIADGS